MQIILSENEVIKALAQYIEGSTGKKVTIKAIKYRRRSSKTENIGSVVVEL